MLSDWGYIARKLPADDADDSEELTSVDESGMEDKNNREPEGERHAEDHDDAAESTETKNETGRMDVPCPNSCLPCKETVNKSHNPNMHEGNCHEAGISCVLCGKTSRAESDLKGHNVSQHTEDCIGNYKSLKGR